MVDLLPSFDAIPLFPKKKKKDSARFKSERVTKKKSSESPKGTSNNTMIWPLPRPTLF